MKNKLQFISILFTVILFTSGTPPQEVEYNPLMKILPLIMIVIFIAFVIIGTIRKSGKKNKLKKKKIARADIEFSEFESALSKKIFNVNDSENNLLLTIYPSWVNLLGVNDNGEIQELDPNSSKKSIISDNFETEINEINEELNGNFTYKFNIPTDLEVKKVPVESLDSYHVLDFIDFLETGFWVIYVSEYSKKTGLKIYIINLNNQDEEISYNSAILIRNEGGVNKSLTVSTNCITQNHEVKHLIKKQQ